MKTIFLNIGYRALQYLYINRKTIYSIYRDYKNNPQTTFDGKVTFKELIILIQLIKKSGLFVTPEDTIYTTEGIVGGQYEIPQNTAKKLVFTQQTSVTCAIYATGRAITYNTEIDFDEAFYEKVIQRAKDTGRLKPTGMTFDNAMLTWKEIIKQEMNLDLLHEKQWIGSERYKEWKDKGYANVMGGYIFPEYLLDREDDGRIDITGYTWKGKLLYGHAWSEIQISHHVDNYSESKTIKYNEYYNNYTQDFIAKGKFFGWARFPYIEKVIVEGGEYRQLAGESVIENPDKLVETIRSGTPDEAVAAIEIIVNRKLK